MSLVSYSTGPTAVPLGKITNNEFWPDIEPDDFRAVERVDSSVTDARIVRALEIALTDVNRQLAQWQMKHQSTGAENLSDVSTPSWARQSHYKDLYLRGVYATAMASLLERSREYSATASGDAKGIAKDEAADDYLRDARFALGELLNGKHTIVELI